MTSTPPAELLARIATFAREKCAGHDAAHDERHLARVVENGRRLAAAEVAAGHVLDPVVVEAACWLHDVCQLPKGSGAPGEAARRSAETAAEFLRRAGIDEERVAAVSQVIETHSFTGGLAPATLEAAIVQDADRLDALGAIGIARLWVTGVRLGGVLYDTDDPSAARRELDDRAFGLDHIERKLLKLPGLMHTGAGRVEAERRATFLRIYREQFLREIGHGL